MMEFWRFCVIIANTFVIDEMLNIEYQDEYIKRIFEQSIIHILSFSEFSKTQGDKFNDSVQCSPRHLFYS